MPAKLGDDADTTAAIYGQIASARYEVEGIPTEWRSRLALVKLITQMADSLYYLPRLEQHQQDDDLLQHSWDLTAAVRLVLKPQILQFLDQTHDYGFNLVAQHLPSSRSKMASSRISAAEGIFP